MLKYEPDFAIPVKAAGLTPGDCLPGNALHPGQWRIRGGSKHQMVDCWPNTHAGFRYKVDGQQKETGTIADAIRLAGPPEKPAAGLAEIPPFDMPDDPEERQVGFIRWCWRRMGLRWLWRKIW